MIVLDAGVLIALFDADDAHHRAAVQLFEAHPEEPMTIGPINLAELLVRAAREHLEQRMLADLRALSITTTALPDDGATRLARLRAHTGSKMPDCCVLLTAEQTSARIATFDEQLKQRAGLLGFETV